MSCNTGVAHGSMGLITTDQGYMRPGATKGTLRRENEISFFDELCLITFHWSF